MIDHAVAVGAFGINKKTAAWEKYWIDSEVVEKKIRSQDRKPAGFVRAPNFLRFYLMRGAASVPFGHAHFRTRSQPRIVDFRGRDVLRHEVVFDNDIQGAENEEMLWTIMSMPTPKSEKHFNFTLARRMALSTEQDEPLLLLADFAAGIVHAAHLPEARKYLPLSQEDATELLERLHASGILAIHQADFKIDCREVFGDLAETQTEREERTTC